MLVVMRGLFDNSIYEDTVEVELRKVLRSPRNMPTVAVPPVKIARQCTPRMNRRKCHLATTTFHLASAVNRHYRRFMSYALVD
jgi:hypothetical protein